MTADAIQAIIGEIVSELNEHPVDLLSNGAAAGERRYLEILQQQYVRTVGELLHILGQREIPDFGRIKVLEIGSFLGVICFALRRLRFQVTAQDIPEFQNNSRLQDLYRRHGINFTAVNLKRYKLPYPDNEFDLVIMCEVLEHLNFNPLPVVKEINRILKPGGQLYMSVPNQLSAGNRLKLLRGRSIQAAVEEFYQQLDAKTNMIVGLHWREYSKQDLHELLEPMGFQIKNHYFYQENKAYRYKRLKFSLKDLLGEFVPSLRPIHVLLAEKTAQDTHQFTLTDALS